MYQTHCNQLPLLYIYFGIASIETAHLYRCTVNICKLTLWIKCNFHFIFSPKKQIIWSSKYLMKKIQVYGV